MSVMHLGSPYARLGGADGVKRLVDAFYNIVEQDPDGAPLEIMHRRGHGLAHARAEQTMFLSGFFVGPQLYLEHHRHVNVREIHAHLDIGETERQSWLICMDRALTATGTEPTLHTMLMERFRRITEMLLTRRPSAT